MVAVDDWSMVEGKDTAFANRGDQIRGAKDVIYLSFSAIVGRGCFTKSMTTFMNVKKIIASEEAIPIACGVVFICVVGIKKEDV